MFNQKQVIFSLLLLLFLSLVSVMFLNYYGFCFHKMRFINQHDLEVSIHHYMHKNKIVPSNCYGAYLFSTKKVYRYLKKDIDGGYLYDGGLLSRILGLSYARINIKSNQSLIISNCGNIYQGSI